MNRSYVTLNIFNTNFSLFQSNLLGKESHIDCLVDSIQLELSSHNVRMMTKLASPLLNTLSGVPVSTPSSRKKSNKSRSALLSQVQLNAELNNTNVYLVADNDGESGEKSGRGRGVLVWRCLVEEKVGK